MRPEQVPVTAGETDLGPFAGVVYCPDCGMPAWVEWRDTALSTAGPVELVKIRCFARHWFLMPAENLTWGVDAAPAL